MTQGKSNWVDQALSTNPRLSGVEVLTAVPWNSGRGSPLALCQCCAGCDLGAAHDWRLSSRAKESLIVLPKKDNKVRK